MKFAKYDVVRDFKDDVPSLDVYVRQCLIGIEYGTHGMKKIKITVLY